MRRLYSCLPGPLLLIVVLAAQMAVADPSPRGCEASGFRLPKCRVAAPEIDVGSGLAAIAVLLAGLALAYERRRDA